MQFCKLALGGLLLLAGCSELKLKNVRIGAVAREVKGDWNNIFHDRKNAPFVRFQGNFEVNDELDFWTRFDTTSGNFGLDMYHINGEVAGNMQSFGAGVSYFPFEQDKLSLDLGGEFFMAEVNLQAKFGPLLERVNDGVYGWGLNAGLTYEHPISDNTFFFATGGYNFTDNRTKRTDLDFDGFYSGVGIGITLP